jgi:hypothetical protein
MKERITDLIYQIEIEKEKRQKAFEESLKGLNKIMSLAQHLCDHSETEYIPDASGNNDSYHVCLICGLEKKRFK